MLEIQCLSSSPFEYVTHILSARKISWNARRWTGSADHKPHVHSSRGRRATRITDCLKKKKKRRRIKTGTTAAKTWEDPSKTKQNRKLLFIYTKRNTFKCFFYHSESTGVRLGLVARLMESGSFLCCAWDPPGCQSALILFGFPTHFTPPLRWTLSPSDIKDLSETLSGLKYQSESRTPRLRSHTPMW